MHRTEIMSITSQLTTRVWVRCTVPRSGTFSKVARILAPLIDISIGVSPHSEISLYFKGAGDVFFRLGLLRRR